MPDRVAKIHRDAFSSGQVSSKIWLCQELEKIEFTKPLSIWIYGGWHAISAFLLLSREKLPISCIRSFDVDPECQEIADCIMENWIWQDWKFKAFTADCNMLNPLDHSYGTQPDLIINTSVEHFENPAWYENIPPGMLVALQSNNMVHGDHLSPYYTAEDFFASYRLDPLIYNGQMDFKYPDWSFSRYMMIGRKPMA